MMDKDQFLGILDKVSSEYLSDVRNDLNCSMREAQLSVLDVALVDLDEKPQSIISDNIGEEISPLWSSDEFLAPLIVSFMFEASLWLREEPMCSFSLSLSSASPYGVKLTSFTSKDEEPGEYVAVLGIAVTSFLLIVETPKYIRYAMAKALDFLPSEHS